MHVVGSLWSDFSAPKENFNFCQVTLYLLPNFAGSRIQTGIPRMDDNLQRSKTRGPFGALYLQLLQIWDLVRTQWGVRRSIQQSNVNLRPQHSLQKPRIPISFKNIYIGCIYFWLWVEFSSKTYFKCLKWLLFIKVRYKYSLLSCLEITAWIQCTCLNGLWRLLEARWYPLCMRIAHENACFSQGFLAFR